MFDRFLPERPSVDESNKEWSLLWDQLGLRETAFIKHPGLVSRKYAADILCNDDLRSIGLS